jgi:hypothetical protein
MNENTLKIGAQSESTAACERTLTTFPAPPRAMAGLAISGCARASGIDEAA